MVSRSQRKFELSIMIWGGICSKGLSNLVLLEGPENEFSYAQALLYYNENFNWFKNNGVLYFEQDGAAPQTSVANKKLISKLFGENSSVQNPKEKETMEN